MVRPISKTITDTISQLRNKDPKGPRKFLKEEAHISTKVGPEVSAGEIRDGIE